MGDEQAATKTQQWLLEWRDYLAGRWGCTVPRCGKPPYYRITDSKTGVCIGYACQCDYPKTTAHLEAIKLLCAGRKIVVNEVEL